MSEAQKRSTLADYKGTERHVRRVPWPGLQREIGVLRLVCAEIQQAYFAAREHFSRQRQAVDGAGQRLFQDEVDFQLVYRMLIAPDSKRPEDRICKSVDELRRLLEPDEVAHFLELHQRMQEEQVAAWSEAPAFDPHVIQIGKLIGCPEDATAHQIVEAARRLAGQPKVTDYEEQPGA